MENNNYSSSMMDAVLGQFDSIVDLEEQFEDFMKHDPKSDERSDYVEMTRLVVGHESIINADLAEKCLESNEYMNTLFDVFQQACQKHCQNIDNSKISDKINDLRTQWNNKWNEQQVQNAYPSILTPVIRGESLKLIAQEAWGLEFEQSVSKPTEAINVESLFNAAVILQNLIEQPREFNSIAEVVYELAERSNFDLRIIAYNQTVNDIEPIPQLLLIIHSNIQNENMIINNREFDIKDKNSVTDCDNIKIIQEALQELIKIPGLSPSEPLAESIVQQVGCAPQPV